MSDLPPIAFLDVETTGLDPAKNRIAEIGIVFMDGGATIEWSCLLAPGARRFAQDASHSASNEPAGDDAPHFKDIAAALAHSLTGHLLVAHNARFDYGFLKAEFHSAGIEFGAQVLCSLMLSRALYPAHARHDLDSLVDRHRLDAGIRHRALPDARLVAQFWRVIHCDHDRETIEKTTAELLAGPVLPEHLDPTLIERLPDSPGVYTFHDDAGAVLRVGKAGNLRLHLMNYFRLDRASTKAIFLAHRVKNITWRVARGRIGAQLQQAVLQRSTLPPAKRTKREELFSWKLVPAAYPCFELVSTSSSCRFEGGESFGLFASERKARNSLSRLATRHSLCRELLGIDCTVKRSCVARDCGDKAGNRTCKSQRLKHLLKIFTVICDLRVATWPYRGPIGIREREDLHIIDQWCYLGTARNATEVHETLTSSPHIFDSAVFHFLTALLPAFSSKHVVPLAADSTPERKVAEPACGEWQRLACLPDGESG